MQRRSNATFGYVNFPIDQPPYKNTKEGGLIVKMVVLPYDPIITNDPQEQPWDICCGVGVHDLLQESLVADSAIRPIYSYSYKTSNPSQPTLPVHQNKDTHTNLIIDLMQMDQNLLMDTHYPHSQRTEDTDPYERLISTRYLASIVIGSTGWSGFDEEKYMYFCAQYEHLNSQGQLLYQMMEQLYPNAQVRLLTFLDT